MGIFKWLKGGRTSLQLRLPAESNSRHPGNPGDLGQYRSAAIVQSLKELPTDPTTAAAWEGASSALLEQRKAVTKSVVRALGNATQLEKLDTELTRAWYQYQAALADANLEKSRALAGYLKVLQGQRAAYSQLSATGQRAEVAADRRTESIEANLRGYLGNG